MIRHFSQLLVISIFLSACSPEEINQSKTEVISDSYFFQKKIFNVNLYRCVSRNDRFSANHLITSDRLGQIRLSEIVEDQEEIEGCTLESFKLNELTPNYSYLLNSSFLFESSVCTSLKDEELETNLEPYTSTLEREEIKVWTGITDRNENNFLWVNVWQSEESRTEFMSYWLDTRKSGMLANDLKDVAYCQTPEVLMFLK
tara:strand:- start:671 stop:1273 length:603 start_codon:yes stop_codon:yes gene_type:complete